MFRFLIEDLGASAYLKNKNGVSVMHKAALDDNNFAITYLRDKLAHPIQEADYQGNTPLHFACSQGSENAIYWLLGFGHEVNCQNTQKETPLHLLLKNKSMHIPAKSVRELIFKGASRDLTDDKGLTPYALACQHEEEGVREELKLILGPQPCYVPCLHLKQPLLKLDRSKLTISSFLTFLVLDYACLQLFVLPFNSNQSLMVPMALLLVLTLFAFFTGALRDPGQVKKSTRISFLKLNEYFDPSFICPKCEVLRPQDSRHCYICNRCVQRFDHHCQWMNTCIGVGNHLAFFLFLVGVWVYSALGLWASLSSLATTPSEIEGQLNQLNYPLNVGIIAVGEGVTTALFYAGACLTILVGGFFFIPVTLLLIVHTQNLMSNQTTLNRLKS
mmetsp:Transcript_8320/g.13911  ORF Transcript_8320/g.13911 Transcript_8320/m.13911 type:complete len:388 (-) Transcript_8320:541-1704(-)